MEIHTLVQVNHNCKSGAGDVIADPELPDSLLADKLRRLSGKQVAGVMTAEQTSEQQMHRYSESHQTPFKIHAF